MLEDICIDVENRDLGIGDHVIVDTMLGRIVASDGDMHKVEVEGVAIWYDERSITFVGCGELT